MSLLIIRGGAPADRLHLYSLSSVGGVQGYYLDCSNVSWLFLL